MRKHKFALRRPEWIFILIALTSGIGLCFLIPMESGFDENTHMARIWEISGGYLIPNQRLSQGPYLPAAFMDVSYPNNFFFDPVNPNYFEFYRNKRIDWNNFLDQQTRSVYFPAMYLPQAFITGLLGRVLDAPVLFILYSVRMLYLLGYILLTFFAIRLIPFGKWLLTVLALAPMTIYQASIISPDAYTNGVCFLFVAWILRTALQEKPITWRQLWVTIVITALLLSVKVNSIFLLPLLLLLVWKRFESKKMLLIMVGAVIILFAGLGIGWNLIAYSRYYLNDADYGAIGQTAFILSHPGQFMLTFIHDIATHGAMYLQDWIAIYGYRAGQVPIITYILVGGLILFSLLISPMTPPINRKTRILLILTGIIGSFFTILVLYLTFNPIGSTEITGVQGRYFIPIAPVLLLGLIPGKKIRHEKVIGAAPLVVGIATGLALVLYMAGVYLSFYVTCGTSAYTPGLCYQPVYKNWESNSPLTQTVTKDVVLQQRFEAICTPLESFRVWSASPSTDPSGETHIVLRDAANGAVLVEELVDNKMVRDYAWVETIFPPIEGTDGRQFILEITSDISQPTAGIAFGVTARREYKYGLIINGNPANYDLMFQYGCKPITIIDAIK